MFSDKPRGWHPLAVQALMVLWVATLGNLPFWQKLAGLPEMQIHGAFWAYLRLGLLMLAVASVWVGLVIWPFWRRVAGVLTLVVCASSSYFMLTYGVVIDSTMLANVAATDTREVLDLLSGSMLLMAVFGIALPGWWWWRQPVRPLGAWYAGLSQLVWIVGGALLAVLLAWTSYQDLASLMRNHKFLRYTLNPYNTVYAVSRLASGPRTDLSLAPPQPIGEDARWTGQAHETAKAPLVLLVVGETMRAANVSLSGYARETTPRLKALHDRGDLVYFEQASSCGTNTQVSVPCMFSHLNREAFDNRDAHYESLLDVLQRAGVGVMWLDNQSGCKGVCDRVPHQELRGQNDPQLCADGECHDELLLKALPPAVASIDPARAARGTVMVLHLMGSHGPAYFKRYPEGFRRFQPECATNVLPDCTSEQLVNTYDNTVLYTDHVLASTIEWLRQQHRPTALFYLSDHGESLGENGLYLHGMPYALAPKEQTHVPMLAWFSPSWQESRGWSMACASKRARTPVSHDDLFSTMLGMAQVSTSLYQPEQDLFRACLSH